MTRPGGTPDGPPPRNGGEDNLHAGPLNDYENYRASFSGADYHITAVIPHKDRFEQSKERIGRLQSVISKLSNDPNEKLTVRALERELSQAQAYAASPEATFKTFGEIQTLSITTRRSVEPVRNLGEPTPAFYTRGPRTVAGSMIFILLAEDPLLDLYKLAEQDKFDREPAFIQDRMPPFNIIITAFNEYGHVMESALLDVTIIASGLTLSIDDLYTEVQYTYVARWMLPMAKRTRKNALMARMGRSLVTSGLGRVSDLAKPARPDAVNPDGLAEQFNGLT